MDYKTLYEVTYKYLLEKAKAHNIDENKLKKYLQPNQGNSEKKAQKLNDVFYRLAFHAQNATSKRNVIKFSEQATQEGLKKCLFDFDYKKVINTYKNIDKLYKKLGEFIQYKNKDTKQEKQVLYKYAKTLLSCAHYLSEFEDYDALIQRFNKLGNMLPIYLSYELEGFGIPLACDFLKELDGSFDFPKPDVHIKEILKELDFIPNSYSGDKLNYISIKVTKEIANNMGISAYELDKIWWLICTETFYLDDNQKNTVDTKRKEYIETVKEKQQWKK